MSETIEKSFSKYWPVLVFIMGLAVQYGMFKSAFEEQSKSIDSLKSYTNNTYGQVKKLESRVDIHDIKLTYQSEQNVQVLSSVKELTQSTSDLRVAVEGFRAQLAAEAKRNEK